ncbi:MAG: ribosome rescue protein RqcH [Candidatus Thorarchaeota archaeon]|jgi:predicted ribosome quality control (RQC) complex YloA/Tae2 family protein
MKETMSNIDIRMILPELRSAAEGAFIKNVYQYGDVFVLKLYQPAGGTSQLLVQPGRRIHLTEFRRAAPRVPPKFCTVLRKYLRDKRVVSVEQHDLDRIVVITIGGEDSSYKLVAELFGNGNLLLLDPEDKIFIAMKYKKMRDRDVMPKAAYLFPPPRGEDIFGLAEGSVDAILAESNANVVRTLASRLNLDSLSCEEICALSGVGPKTKVPELEGQARTDLEMGLGQFIEKLREGVNGPLVVLDETEEGEEEEATHVAFLPFPFEVYRGNDSDTFETFSQATDEFFGVSVAEEEDEKLSAVTKERQRLQRIIDKQQESITNLEKKTENLKIEGDLIYVSFQIVQDVLDTIRNARADGMPWTQILKTVEDGKEKGNQTALLIRKIVPSQGQIIVRLGDVDVTLDIRLSAQDNATLAYDSSKKAKRKSHGARQQIEKTRKKLEHLTLEEVDVQIERRPMKFRKKRWYEKFRWFISSEGHLVLGGRDVKSNERLAKRHLGANDVFFHAALHGAPYVIVKVLEDSPNDQTLQEAAQFAVTFSRAWQDGISSGDAYWVTPEQVSFTPPTGEYLPAGGVMLYGTKNYIRRVPVEISVGVIIDEGSAIPVSGPASAVASQTEFHVGVRPGGTKKGQLVKEIMNRLRQLLPEETRHLITEIPQEDLMRVLPSGGGEITSKA